MSNKSTTKSYRKYKSCLLNMLNNTTPTLGVVINHGVTSVYGELYSFVLKQESTGKVVYTKPHYQNPMYIDTEKNSLNTFVMSGVLLSSNIHNSRTYITLRQYNIDEVIDIRCVIDSELTLDNHFGSPCIVLGYVFPRPLGTYGLSVSACCEVLKIMDTIEYNITKE